MNGYTQKTFPASKQETHCAKLFGALVLLFAISAAALSSTARAENSSPQAHVELGKLEQYQQRITRLEHVIKLLKQELELLHAQADAVSISLETQQADYEQALVKFESAQDVLSASEQSNFEARLQNARFEFFLVERRYNKSQRELSDVHQMIDQKTVYLTNRTKLLERNQQGVAWQKQKLRELGQPQTAERRLASNT
ncbi:MAG: hypothetical protein AB8B86_08020 [Pseudomonadales bacterium]